MLKWAPVFHFYQPPTQNPEITRHALKTSYLPFLDLLLNHAEAKATLNITGSLTLQINELKHPEFFDKVAQLRQRGQIALINSPFYHPITPLTPLSVISRQLRESSETISHFYGQKLLEGIFPPELAIDLNSLQELTDNCEFVLIDESTINPNFGLQEISPASLYGFNNTVLVVSSRAVTTLIRTYPYKLKAKPFLKFLQENTHSNQIVVSVNDVEVFGHHYEERLGFLEKIFSSGKLQFLTISEVLADSSEKPKLPPQKISASSWETTTHQLQNNIAYPLWQSPQNQLQKQYLKLAETAYQALDSTPEPQDDLGLVYSSARRHYDKGISSCHLYWLSNAPWWHPELAEMGARELIKSIRTLPNNTSPKKQAETLYSQLVHNIWQYHWSGEPYRQYDRYDKQREKMLARLPDLNKYE